MKIRYSSRFKKQYKKINPKNKHLVLLVIQKLLADEYDPVLHNHKLQGSLLGYRSINVQNDMRIVYRRENDVIYLRALGSHSELYS